MVGPWLALGVLLYSPAAAAPWTVDGLVAQAQRVSPAVAAAEQESGAAAAQRRQAGAYPNPTASVEDAIDWRYSLTQTFELPPARRARLSVEDRRVEQARLRAAGARLAVRAQVEELAYSLLAIRRRLALIEDNVSLLARLRATLPERYKPGLRNTAETLRVDLEAAGTRDELSRVRAEETGARASLNAFLLQPSSAPLEMTDELAPGFEDLEPAAVEARALRADPGLRLAEAGSDEQAAALRAARAGRWPTIDAGPSLNRPRDGGGVLLGGFQASVALPVWDRRQGDIQAAEARRAAAEASTEQTRRSTLAEVDGLLADYASARDRARTLARQGLLEQSVKIRTQALLGYQQGLLNLTDALDAIRTSTQVQRDYIQSLLDGRRALIGLDAHLGGPP